MWHSTEVNIDILKKWDRKNLHFLTLVLEKLPENTQIAKEINKTKEYTSFVCYKIQQNCDYHDIKISNDLRAAHFIWVIMGKKSMLQINDFKTMSKCYYQSLISFLFPLLPVHCFFTLVSSLNNSVENATGSCLAVWGCMQFIKHPSIPLDKEYNSHVDLLWELSCLWCFFSP